MSLKMQENEMQENVVPIRYGIQIVNSYFMGTRLYIFHCGCLENKLNSTFYVISLLKTFIGKYSDKEKKKKRKKENQILKEKKE